MSIDELDFDKLHKLAHKYARGEWWCRERCPHIAHLQELLVPMAREINVLRQIADYDVGYTQQECEASACIRDLLNNTNRATDLCNTTLKELAEEEMIDE